MTTSPGRSIAALAVLLSAFAATPLSAQKAAVPRATAHFDIPAWAFPGTSPEFVPAAAPLDTSEQLRVPGSMRSYTLGAIHNQLEPADWTPESHPAAPDVVLHARPAIKFACGYCHLPDGQGRSENATLAGLPADYIIRQLADMRSGARTNTVSSFRPTANMLDVARNITDEEAAAAARYFASIGPKPRYHVVERIRIPMTYAVNGLYTRRPGTDSEPLGMRLLDVSDDFETHERRGPSETFTTYVPPGSIARGRRIATGAATLSPTRCATCHGMDLRGLALAPPIAGRSPAYILRQLIGVRTGSRHGDTSAPMQVVTSKLSLEDMIAVSAYAGSRAP